MTNPLIRLTLLLVTMTLNSAVWSETNDTPAPLNRAQQLVFMADHLRDVGKGEVLNYDFASRKQAEEQITDTVKVTVTDVLEDKTHNLEFDFLSGSNHIDFAPAVGYTGNPVIIHFLERDISRMVHDTGGSSHYFRNRIRRSFNHPELQSVEVAFQGKLLPATQVTVRPFLNDPNIERFPAYANKRYDFIFSEQVPGGLFRIHTRVPGTTAGEAYIEEDLTFSGLSPAS